MEVFDRNPVLKERLFESMRDMGIEPERYIVGNELNSINPVTGQPEFFLKKIFRRIRKGIRDIGSRARKAAADVSGYAAPIAGAFFGAPAGAAVGALLGQYKRENPGDPTQGMQMALRGGLTGLATNIAGGQNPFLGKGLSGAEFRTPSAIFKQFFQPGSGETPFRDFFMGEGDKSNVRNFVESYFDIGGGGKPNLDTIEKEIIEAGGDQKKIRKILVYGLKIKKLQQ